MNLYIAPILGFGTMRLDGLNDPSYFYSYALAYTYDTMYLLEPVFNVRPDSIKRQRDMWNIGLEIGGYFEDLSVGLGLEYFSSPHKSHYKWDTTINYYWWSRRTTEEYTLKKNISGLRVTLPVKMTRIISKEYNFGLFGGLKLVFQHTAIKFQSKGSIRDSSYTGVTSDTIEADFSLGGNSLGFSTFIGPLVRFGSIDISLSVGFENISVIGPRGKGTVRRRGTTYSSDNVRFVWSPPDLLIFYGDEGVPVFDMVNVEKKKPAVVDMGGWRINLNVIYVFEKKRRR